MASGQYANNKIRDKNRGKRDTICGDNKSKAVHYATVRELWKITRVESSGKLLN